MLVHIRNDVRELIWGRIVVETIVVIIYTLSEDVIFNPQISISDEHLTIKVICDSSTILNITHDILHGVQLEGLVHVECLSHVLVNIEERGLKVGVIEFIRNTEAKGAELTTLLHNRVEEADSEQKVAPLFIRFNFLKEILVYHCREGTLKTSFEAFWWLCHDLD